MRTYLVILIVLACNSIYAQISIDEIIGQECEVVESDTSIYSDFHDFEVSLPSSWYGYMDGENPKWKIQDSTSECSMTISGNLASEDVFDWARSNFNPELYEILEFKKGRILVEKNESGRIKMLSLSNLKDTSGQWIWRIRLRLPEEKDSRIFCDITYIFEQLMK
ncbi:hypothetical protein O3Q51_18265 [Cryomorphaceae bacterium 1068]|nr:hypothetical protein [Cryomorphaceae bacterium 1068]